jgi:hypothetical protein
VDKIQALNGVKLEFGLVHIKRCNALEKGQYINIIGFDWLITMIDYVMAFNGSSLYPM